MSLRCGHVFHRDDCYRVLALIKCECCVACNIGSSVVSPKAEVATTATLPPPTCCLCTEPVIRAHDHYVSMPLNGRVAHLLCMTPSWRHWLGYVCGDGNDDDDDDDDDDSKTTPAATSDHQQQDVSAAAAAIRIASVTLTEAKAWHQVVRAAADGNGRTTKDQAVLLTCRSLTTRANANRDRVLHQLQKLSFTTAAAADGSRLTALQLSAVGVDWLQLVVFASKQQPPQHSRAASSAAIAQYFVPTKACWRLDLARLGCTLYVTRTIDELSALATHIHDNLGVQPAYLLGLHLLYATLTTCPSEDVVDDDAQLRRPSFLRQFWRLPVSDERALCAMRLVGPPLEFMLVPALWPVRTPTAATADKALGGPAALSIVNFCAALAAKAVVRELTSNAQIGEAVDDDDGDEDDEDEGAEDDPRKEQRESRRAKALMQFVVGGAFESLVRSASTSVVKTLEISEAAAAGTSSTTTADLVAQRVATAIGQPRAMNVISVIALHGYVVRGLERLLEPYTGGGGGSDVVA